MTTNVPPEPDEFQTRMRQPANEGDVEDTNRGGPQPGQSPPAPPQSTQPQQTQTQPQQTHAQPVPPQPTQPQAPFAPPGFGSSSQSQPPAGYGAPQHQPSPFGQQTQSFGQQSQAPQQQPWDQHAQQAQQTGGGYGQQQPAGYPQGGFGQQQPGWSGAPQKPRDANPLKAAFDFSFNTYATPGIVKIIYIIGIVLAALSYLIAVITAFTAFGGRDYGVFETEGTIVPGILMLLFGWVPAAFFVLVLRLALEQVLSSVRTATDVRVLRERSDTDAEKADKSE